MSRFLEQFFLWGDTARQRSFGRQGATWLITRTSMLYSNRSHDPFGLVLGSFCCSRQELSESMSRFLEQFFLGEIQPGKDPLADRSYLVDNENFHALFQPIARSVRAGSRFILLLSSRAFRIHVQIFGAIFPWGDTARQRSFGRQGATWLITRTSMLYSNRSHDPFGLVLGSFCCSRQELSELVSRYLDQFFHGEIQPGKDPLADRELPG